MQGQNTPTLAQPLHSVCLSSTARCAQLLLRLDTLQRCSKTVSSRVLLVAPTVKKITVCTAARGQD